jgi:FkbM family methyltransferase
MPSSPLRKHGTSVALFGKKFYMPGSITSFIGSYWQIVHKDQYHSFEIKNGDVVIDAGANLGVFSIFIAKKYPQSTIYAFEPTPAVFQALEKNTEPYPNIKVFNCALGDKDGEASLVEIDTINDGGANYIGEEGTSIEMKKIDSLNIVCNFLKMDVEGYEANILRGAAETIKRYKPIVAMSAYHKPDDHTVLPSVLNSIAPYRCELHRDCEEDFICKPILTDAQ